MRDADQRFPAPQQPMDDRDFVFARFKTDKPVSASRHETLTIPARAGATGSRVVQVVHMRAGTTIPDRPRRIGAKASTAAWDAVFAASPTAPLSSPAARPATTPGQPVNPAVSTLEPAKLRSR